jgi:hypothetical protein
MSRPDKHGWAVYASERLYRALLAAYPREFRREYGPQMRQVFRDLCREERRKNRKTGLGQLWIRTALDLATTALGARISGLGRPYSKEVGLNDYKLAGLGFALLLAPLYFVSASLLKYGLGIGVLFDPLDRALTSDPANMRVFNLVSPVVFLGGLALALVLNVYAVLRFDFGREDGTIVSTVRLEAKFWNLAVAFLCLVLLSMLVGYLFLENFTYRP